MTTAHRPTFDPARGKEANRGPAYHQRLLPAYTKLKYRKPGQLDEDLHGRDLRTELLAAEAAHYASKGKKWSVPGRASVPSPLDVEGDGSGRSALSRMHPEGDGGDDDGDGRLRHDRRHGTASSLTSNEEDEDPAAKRRRILEESRDIDADSGPDENSDSNSSGSGSGSGSDSDSDEDSDDDSEDELQRELEKVRRERAERKAREEEERAREEAAAKQQEAAHGNPLLQPTAQFGVKRRWDDDSVFKNQARGTDDRDRPKEFVNDMLRSDFHRRFMNKYVR